MNAKELLEIMRILSQESVAVRLAATLYDDDNDVLINIADRLSLHWQDYKNQLEAAVKAERRPA